MIISASYKTDIPAFYGRWFLNRLGAGFCRMVNPYGGQTYRIDLTRPAVDGFVFWTKNLGPFLGALDVVADAGFPFVVQHSVTGLPTALERSVPDWERAAEHMAHVRDRWGPRAAVWRYDPIVTTDSTPPSWHRETFARIAGRLRGVTDEAVVSFLQPYRKTARNMDAAGQPWRDPDQEEKRALLADLAGIAAEHGMALTLCTQPELEGVPGVVPTRCVDAERLSDVAGRPVSAREKGNRPGCFCAESRDIGDYDTCPHGCVYCYAVANRATAQRRFAAHDPEGEFLFARDRP
jgi:DNA repair photolyase